MTPVEGPQRRYSIGMRLWAALLAAAAVASAGTASAAGLDEALRASGLDGVTRAARAIEPQQRTPDWDGSLSGALWLREEAFADSERSECGGQSGCGKQVSTRWLTGRQAAAASRALEETLLHRYGVRGWARTLLSQPEDAPHAGLAALAGAALLYANGLHVRTVVSGLRLAMDVVPGRRLANDRGDIAKLEVGAVGTPLSLTAAFGRSAPTLGAAYRLRY